MAAAVVQSTAVSQTGTTTTLAFTLGSAPTLGNVVVAIIGLTQNGATGSMSALQDVTIPSGWTRVMPNAGITDSGVGATQALASVTVLAKAVASGETATSYSFAASGGSIGGALYELSGVNTSIASLVSNYGTFNNTNLQNATVTMPALTPVYASSLILTGIVCQGVGVADTPTVAAPFTAGAFAEKSNHYNEIATFYQANPALSSQAASITTTATAAGSNGALFFSLLLPPPLPVASPTALQVIIGGTGISTVTQAGNSTFTAVSSATGVATVAVSGATVTVTAVAAGTATITVTGANSLTTTIAVVVSAPPTGKVQLLPASGSYTGTTARAGSLANLLTGSQAAYYAANLPAYVLADLGAAAPIFGIWLKPRPFSGTSSIILTYFPEANLGGAVLLGGSVALTGPTDSNGTNIYTIPTGVWPLNTVISKYLNGSAASFRYVLFGQNSNTNASFDLSSYRIIGTYASGVLFAPLAPVVVQTSRTTSTVTVSLTSDTANASIVYTIDGTTPAVNASGVPTGTSVLVANASSVTIPQSKATSGAVQVQAIAVYNATISSDITYATYNLPATITVASTLRSTDGNGLTCRMGSVYPDFGPGRSNLYWMHGVDFGAGPSTVQQHTPFYGIRCYSSPDCISWTSVEAGSIRNPFSFLTGGNALNYPFDRPHIIKIGSTYYLWANALLQNGSGVTTPFKAIVWSSSSLGSAWTLVTQPFALIDGTYEPGDNSTFTDPVTGQAYWLSALFTPTSGGDYEIGLATIASDGHTLGTFTMVDTRLGREAPQMFYRNGFYYLVTSPTVGYAASDWDWKKATSIAGLVSQAANTGSSGIAAANGFSGGSSVGTTFFSQPDCIWQMNGLVDAAGFPVMMYMGTNWNANALNSSPLIIAPLHFDASGNMSLDLSDSTWSLAPPVAAAQAAVASRGALFRRF